jgi:hypothetical protein
MGEWAALLELRVRSICGGTTTGHAPCYVRSVMRILRLCLFLVAACSSKASTPSTPPDPNCGMKPTDWCAAPAGDPCGEHKDTAACKADAKCVGMPYRGESLVACQYDDRGFGTNCPTVGCRSAAK